MRIPQEMLRPYLYWTYEEIVSLCDVNNHAIHVAVCTDNFVEEIDFRD